MSQKGRIWVGSTLIAFGALLSSNRGWAQAANCPPGMHVHGAPGKHHQHPHKPPGSCARLVATRVSQFQINLSWPNQTGDEAGYEIERSTDGANFTQIAEVLPNTTTYRNTGLFPGTKYFYRVRAFNAAGHGNYSQVAAARTEAVSCPLFVSDLNPLWIVRPVGLNDAVAVSAGFYNMLVLRANGTVVDLNRPGTNPPPSWTNIVAIAAGSSCSFALRQDGTVVTWSRDDSPTLEPPTNLTGVVAIAAGANYALALRNNGTVVGWGDNEVGQISIPADLHGVVAIAAGVTHSLALRSDGTVVHWGDDWWPWTLMPTNLTDCVAIAIGDSHASAVKANGKVVGWGYYPVIRSNLTHVAMVAEGSYSSLALKEDGTVVRWAGAPGPNYLLTNVAGIVALSARSDRALILSTTPNPAYFENARVLTARRVELTWKDVSSGLAKIQIERAERDPWVDPKAWKSLATLPAGAERYVDTTVKTGRRYYYRARVRTACHDSVFNEPVVADVMVPPAPEVFGIHLQTGVHMSWRLNPVGLLGYRIERATDIGGAPGVWQEIATVDSLVDEYFDNNLEIEQTYWYRIRAFNGLGNSPYTEFGSITLHRPPTPPAPYASVQTPPRISLSWMAFGNQDGFKLERNLMTNGIPGPWIQIAKIPHIGGWFAGYVDLDITTNTTYQYRIRAFNAAGDSLDSPATTVAVLPPLAPTIFATARLVGAKVSWTLPESNIETYTLERAPEVNGVPGPWGLLATGPGYVIDHTDITSAPNVYYWYRVKVAKWTGESPFSEPVRVKWDGPVLPPGFITASLPTELRILSLTIENDDVHLTWQAAGDTTNVVEAVSDLAGTYQPISPELLIGADGNGSFVEIGGATNRVARFYRVREVR